MSTTVSARALPLTIRPLTMTSNYRTTVLGGGLLALFVAVALLAFGPWQLLSRDEDAAADTTSRTDVLTGEPLDTDPTARQAAEEALREDVPEAANTRTGVQGVVLDVRSRLAMPGVEVVALRTLPGLERPLSRFRGLFTNGLWTDTAKPVDILGSTFTQGDGSFEILGLPPGRIFLDARSPRAYLREPGTAALARGEVKTGLELLASPGGRIVGTVVDPDGQPAVGVRVSLRPGLNAFLSQITKRNYRWLETETDADGRYSITGVPRGTGYGITFAGSQMALDERHGIDVAVGETVRVDVRGKVGAQVLGRVVDGDDAPVVGADVAMVYLDISRMLFSADGREEPICTDSSGYFSLDHVAPGRVAFIAVDDAMAPSNIEELAVVDGGVYQDLELQLVRAGTFSGLVVDQDDLPLAGVKVEVRPMDRGRGAGAMKMALRVRRVRSTTGDDGRFALQGITGRSLMVTCSKSDYTTEVHFGVRPDQKDLKIKLSHGVTVRGRVQLADGTPISRFRVRAQNHGSGSEGQRGREREGERAGVTVEVGSRRGRRGWRRGGRGRFPRQGSRSLPEGSSGDMSRGRGRWQEFRSDNGTFVIHGLPPGKVEVRVRAEGYLDPKSQTPELAAGQESEQLTFQLQAGALARGVVLDETTGEPIANATVTAYREKEKRDNGRWRLFQMQADPEDFDFLGLAAMRSQRTVLTDSQGQFEIKGLEGGHKYRFTARHPDLAKASAKEVDVRAEGATENIQIMVGAGGAMEGLVTGAGRRPLGAAMVIAFCPQSGTFKSSTTNQEGYYRIDGLPPGQYFVFKTRMDEKAQDIGLSAMANMRMKMKAVRRGKVSRVDIHDESENGVRVFGVVRENGEPIPRAMITFLGRDREGILGMGIRAQPSDDKGNYEMAGIKPGDYLVQVSRFRGRPEQTSLTVEIPEGVKDFRHDIDLPNSYLAGRVQDKQGNPLAGITVQLGIQDGGESMDGMLGLILRNGVSRARTDKDGSFKLKNVAAGTYRLTASGGRGRGFGGRGGRGGRGNGKYGDVALSNVKVNGTSPIEGIVLTLPAAGSITGTVVDGNGSPVANAQINYVSEKPDRSRRMERTIGDLFGLQREPVRTGIDGRFTIHRVTPGKYRVRAEVQALAPGTADDVVVVEGQPTDCQIRIVKGATLKVRVTNIDGSNLPLASISVFDSKGKPLASKVSVLSVFAKLMRGKTKRDSSGWHEIGNIPPDTYTVIIQEKGQPDIKVQRTIRDGEEARWDINMGEEMKRYRESKKK